MLGLNVRHNHYMRALIVLFSLLASSCTFLINQEPELTVQPNQPIAWHTDSTFDDRSGPQGSISLQIETKILPLRINRPVAFKPLSRELWIKWGIPNEAELAALGYWAGYGEVLYAVRIAGEVQVYHREVEEQASAPPFTLIKRISVAK